MWRQTVARDRVAAFDQIIQEIAVFYPSDSQNKLDITKNEEGLIRVLIRIFKSSQKTF